MKILLLNHNTKGRGTFVRCLQFGRHLVAFGHQVTILTSSADALVLPQREYLQGVEVVSMPDILPSRLRNGGFGVLDTLQRLALVATSKYDVVENFDHRPSVLIPAILAKYIKKTPLISEWTDLHGSGGSLENRGRFLKALMGPFENFTERKSKFLAEKLVVISNGLRKRALELGVPDSKIVWIPGGADVETIKVKSREEARRKAGLPVDIRILGYTGYSHYDMAMMVEAVSRVQARFRDVWLVTTGAKLSENARRQFTDPSRVIELGYLQSGQYENFLCAVDVFVFPFADKEINRGRWPNKIGDYMAAGRPSVSNRTGDLIGLFEKHNVGLLAQDDPQDMAQCIASILENDDLAQRLGENARRAAENHYDWRKLTKTLESCLYEVVRPSLKDTDGARHV